MNTPPQTIQLFITCLIDAFYPNVGMAVVDILEAQGIQVEFPFDQTCCGQPAFNAGVWDEARLMAKHTLDVLSQTHGPVIIPSGSCASMIVHHYLEILGDDPEYASKAKAVSERVYEFTQFLVDELGLSDVGATYASKAVYHPSCHGLRNLNLKHQSKTLLSHVDSLEQVDLPDAERCCGFGGLFAIKMGGISGAMLKQKLDDIEACEVDVVIGSDISCLMHIGGGLQKRGRNIKIKHIAEVLNGNQMGENEG